MNIKRVMPNINNYITSDMDVISPDEKSHEGLIVPQIILDYGSIAAKMKDTSRVVPYALNAIKQIKKSYKEISRQPESPKMQISSEDLSDMEDLARGHGIDIIGYTPVDRSLIFKGKVILFPNAIVFAMEMKRDKIDQAPSKETVGEIFRTYHDLGVVVNVVADFLKSRGYNAQAGPALGGEVNYPLLAEKAGIGVIGKHGLLITPDLGPSLRLAAVFTDVENLPEPDGNRHMWIKDFCKNCSRCVKGCPADAIYDESVVFEDGTEQHIDYKKCAYPFSNQHGCTICVKSCTFYNSSYEKIKKGFLK